MCARRHHFKKMHLFCTKTHTNNTNKQTNENKNAEPAKCNDTSNVRSNQHGFNQNLTRWFTHII